MKLRKIMIAVEYKTGDDSSTFEIFDNIKEAYKFAQKGKFLFAYIEFSDLVKDKLSI